MKYNSKSKKNREEGRAFCALNFLYKHESASPVGLGILPFDWAKNRKYTGFESLERNRFELIVDSQKKNGSLVGRLFMVIEKKDEEYASVHINALDNVLVNPASFYETICKRASNLKLAHRNKGEYMSNLEMYFIYYRGCLTKKIREITQKLLSKKISPIS